MKKDCGQIFDELKEDVTAYAELKFELLKLNTFERAGKLAALFSYALIILFLAVPAALCILLACGLWLGKVLNSPSAGFAIISGCCLLVIGIVVCCKKRLSTKIMNIVISVLNENEEKNA
ncbi:hypothetical protein Barb7_00123 [Bacteroidales bacterium Barb7]|nr:hypothetical protein Barb7_00123 [Bacteroidales bacterium Barb7]